MRNHTLTDLLLHSILLLILSLLPVQTQAQAADIGTAITYQGRLDGTDAPASGSYDFEFSLYDAVIMGAQVGSMLSQTLAVTDGIFNTLLDFGAGAFNNEARFLEIAVQMNGGGYTTLSPRQPFTTVPHATFVESVENNIVMVAKSGGHYSTIGAALTAITTASIDNPFLIRIGPGIYEETINLKSYVSIEGSGKGITIIRTPSNLNSLLGTLNASGEIVAEVRRLSIEAVTTVNAFVIGITIINGGDALTFTDVTVVASGGSAFTYGASITNSSPTLSDTTLIAVGEVLVRGVVNSSSSPTLFNVTVEASGGTNENIAISNNDNSSPRLTRVIGTAVGTNSVGLDNTNDSNPIIKDSAFSGLTYSLINDDTSSVKLFHSQIEGPIAGGGFTCIGAYTDDSVVVDDECDDEDRDRVKDNEDNCPLDANPDQGDMDDDNIGDACDDDKDGDGTDNASDNCPLVDNPDQEDMDDDNIGDACDDSDGDSVYDDVDNCPLNSNPNQDNTDQDDTGDVCDGDHVYSIGDTGPAGGIVFYVGQEGRFETAPHYLDRYIWGCANTLLTGANGQTIGTGEQNTADIVAGCDEPNIAARVANNYVLNGFTDWFLPSRGELNALLLQKEVIGDFLDEVAGYWSSSETVRRGEAWGYLKAKGEYTLRKEAKERVIPVRTF